MCFYKSISWLDLFKTLIFRKFSINVILFNSRTIALLFRIILYLLIRINVVILAVCTVISIKSKEKLPFWISILQGLLIAVVVIAIITQMINGNRHQKEMESVREQTTKIMNNYK